MMILLALVTFALCASARSEQSITEGLLSSQADLALGHEFFETALFLNRGQISAYMYRINRELIDSHTEAYAHMMALVHETNEALDAIEISEENQECLNSVRNRWNLQIVRFGHRLGSCIDVARRMLNGWNGWLSNTHNNGQLVANQVQNLGNKVLAETNIFEGRHEFPERINREFRLALGRARPYRDSFDGFLETVSRTATEVIQILADCDRELEEDFALEIEEDLLRARNC